MFGYREHRTASQRAALSLLILLLPLMAPVTLLAGGPGNGPAVRALGDTLSAIDQLSGRFRQTIYPESGGTATRSTGEFRLQGPGRFLWRIESPDNQLVVTEGITMPICKPRHDARSARQAVRRCRCWRVIATVWHGILRSPGVATPPTSCCQPRRMPVFSRWS